MKITASIKKPKLSSDIFIEYFIAVNNYNSLIENGYQDQPAELMEADLTALKSAITDQVSINEFEQAFGKTENGTPIGIVNDPKYNWVTLFYLDFENSKAFSKTAKKSDYYLYLSLCHKKREDI